MSGKKSNLNHYFGGKGPVAKKDVKKDTKPLSAFFKPKPAADNDVKKRQRQETEDKKASSPVAEQDIPESSRRLKKRYHTEETPDADGLEDDCEGDMDLVKADPRPGAATAAKADSSSAEAKPQNSAPEPDSPAGPAHVSASKAITEDTAKVPIVDTASVNAVVPSDLANESKVPSCVPTGTSKSVPLNSPAPRVVVSDDDGSDLEDSDAEADENCAQEEEEKVVAEVKPTKLKAPKKASKPGKASKKGAVHMEGVGTGALAAAELQSNFDLSKMKTWEAGKPVPYDFLAKAFDEISEVTKRLVIVRILTDVFRAIITLTPGDLLPAVYLAIGKVAPPHEGMELGIGDAVLIKALAEGTGSQVAFIKKEYEEEGDLGTVACKCKNKQRTMFKPKPLTVQGVFKTLRDIAKIEGNKSQEQKKNLIMKLLVAANDAEPGYIIRSLQGKLRIGLAENSVLVALAHAACLQCDNASCFGGDTPTPTGDDLAHALESASRSVRMVYSECPDYGLIIPTLLEKGPTNLLDLVHFMPGTPIKAMLARATNGVGEVLDKFSDCEFTCEYKYDGERAQVHVLEDGSVHIYSRNLENMTTKYPDIVQRMPGALAEGVKSIVLDCEAQGWDPERKVFLPFQTLSTRKRKGAKIEDIKVQVVLMAFDCLYLNGDVMLRKPLTERRDALYQSIKPDKGKIQFATMKTSRDTEELQTFLQESVDACTEGLIVKTLADTYEPSKRSLNWLKLKKDYLEGVGDTFDVAVIGALHGKGKRTGLYGSFLLAIYDEDREEYQTISKIGTGFSEEKLKEVFDQLKEHVIPKPRRYYRYSENEKLIPDIWFDAKIVWEVKAADLSVSPVYTAGNGLVDPVKGISIRFPRLVRSREDKKPEETTTPQQVADMYNRQAVAQANSKPAADEDLW